MMATQAMDRDRVTRAGGLRMQVSLTERTASTMHDDNVRLGDYEYHLYEEAKAGRMTRREVLRRASIMGLSLPVISAIAAACGASNSKTPGGGNQSSGGGATTTTTTAGAGSNTSNTTAPAGGIKRGGTGRIGISVPAATPDPVTMDDEGSIIACQLAGEYLCFPNPDYSLAPRLATSWKANSPKEWTFKLRQGVKFHNGRPMTADDVVSTIDILTDKKHGSSFVSQVSGILEAGQTEKVDDHTVKFHLSAPYVDFPYLLSAFNYNAIILPKGYQLGSFLKKPQGTGAFRVTSYSPGQSVTYDKNPDYWVHGLPYLDGAKLSFFQTDSAQLLAMQGGSLDLTPLVPYGGAQTLTKNSKIQILSQPSSAFRTLQMRTDIGPFKNQDLRLAVASCLDRPSIINSVLTKYGQVGNDHPFAPVFPVSQLAVSQVPQRTQDYTKAKSYLAKAGHPRGLSITLTTENYLDIPAYAQVVKSQLAPAGIDVTINTEQQTAYYGSGKNQPWLSVPFGITDWAERGVPSQTIATAFTSGGIWNSAHWKDPGYTRLFGELNSTLDEHKRRSIAAQMARIQHGAVPDVIAYWLKELRAIGSNVHGVASGPAASLDARGMWLS